MTNISKHLLTDAFAKIHIPADLVEHGELAGRLVDGGLHVHVADPALAREPCQLMEVRREQRRRADHLWRHSSNSRIRVFKWEYAESPADHFAP